MTSLRKHLCSVTIMLLVVLLPGCGENPAPTLHTELAIDIPALQRAAESGNTDSQIALARCYAQGQGTVQDYKEAARWYGLAAAQSNAVALNALGELCEAGRGVPRDAVEAFNHYRAAAELGHAPAQYNLATFYTVGQGVTADANEALKWYRAAGRQGDALAQYNLGMRYMEGNGIAADPVEAYCWLSLAAKDERDATAALDRLKRTMSREQIATGQQRMADFATQNKTAPGR